MRTLEQINAEILANISADPELAALTSPSNFAVYKRVAAAVAGGILVYEAILVQSEEDIQAAIDAGAVGTPAWYADKVLKFQYGYILQLINNVPGYSVIDTDAQIVKRVSYSEADSTLFLKVAKEVGGGIVPLIADELTALEGYLEKIRFAGTDISVISLNADKLRLTANVYYDGALDLPTYKAAVFAAVNNYLANIDFNGQVYISKIIDSVQSVSGTVDMQVIEAIGVQGLNLITFDRVYQTVAGYIEEDAAPNSFDDLFTFIPSPV